VGSANRYLLGLLGADGAAGSVDDNRRMLKDDFAAGDAVDVVINAVSGEWDRAAGIGRGDQAVGEVAIEADVFFVLAVRESEGISVDVARCKSAVEEWLGT